MDGFVKRDFVVGPAARFYSDIWDGEGWQINKSISDTATPFKLIDSLMPYDLPASGIVGSFATFEEAVAKAKELGNLTGASGINEQA